MVEEVPVGVDSVLILMDHNPLGRREKLVNGESRSVVPGRPGESEETISMIDQPGVHEARDTAPSPSGQWPYPPPTVGQETPGLVLPLPLAHSQRGSQLLGLRDDALLCLNIPTGG